MLTPLKGRVSLGLGFGSVTTDVTTEGVAVVVTTVVSEIVTLTVVVLGVIGTLDVGADIVMLMVVVLGILTVDDVLLGLGRGLGEAARQKEVSDGSLPQFSCTEGFC